MEAVIDININKTVMFYDFLHGFCAGRGVRKVTIELNTAQELAIVDQDPLFLMFLDLRKADENLDRGHLIQTLEGYGTGPKMWVIMVKFWLQPYVVTRKNGYHGPQFRATRDTIQGGL